MHVIGPPGDDPAGNTGKNALAARRLDMGARSDEREGIRAAWW